jgi:hypothetical protein
MNRELNKSEKKFIRIKKSEIRKKFWDVRKQEEAITELYKRMLGDPTAKVEESKKSAKKVNKPASAKAMVGKQKAKTASEGKGKMKNKKKQK